MLENETEIEKRMSIRKKYSRIATLINFALAIFFVLLIILILKTLGIIPDPPELFDIILEVTMFLVGVATTAIWSLFRGIQNRISGLEDAQREFNNTIVNIENTLSHFRDHLDLSTRIARLEARMDERDRQERREGNNDNLTE